VSRFGIDTAAPTSSVTQLSWLQQVALYQVFWDGKDALSGVGKYNIDVRPLGTGNESWTPWLTEVTGTSALFAPPDPAAAYEFRSQAIDRLGNTEASHVTADISTEEAALLSYGAYLPLSMR
jgi:hypothetical protein